MAKKLILSFIFKKGLFLILSIAFIFNLKVFALDFELSLGFSYHDVPVEIQKLMSGKSYQKNEYVEFQDLKLCKVKHIGFDGKEHEGEIIVAYEVTDPANNVVVNVAKEVLEIFKELYDAKYPIEKISLIDYYNAADTASMEDNNSSAFNFRYIRDTKKISWHAYGLAIDINPLINPCFHPDTKLVEPEKVEAEKFLDRTLDVPGLIKEGDACHKAFTSRGWEWGGSWNDPKDYMHFQKFSWRTVKPAPKY